MDIEEKQKLKDTIIIDITMMIINYFEENFGKIFEEIRLGTVIIQKPYIITYVDFINKFDNNYINQFKLYYNDIFKIWQKIEKEYINNCRELNGIMKLN
jgi:hypothetical protein